MLSESQTPREYQNSMDEHLEDSSDDTEKNPDPCNQDPDDGDQRLDKLLAPSKKKKKKRGCRRSRKNMPGGFEGKYHRLLSRLRANHNPQ